MTMENFRECLFLQNSSLELKTHEDLASKNLQTIVKSFEFFLQRQQDLLDVFPAAQSPSDLLLNIQKLRQQRDGLQSKENLLKEQCVALSQESAVLKQEIEGMKADVLTLSQVAQLKKEERAILLQETSQLQKNERKKSEALKRVKMVYKTVLDCNVHFLNSSENGDLFLVTFHETARMSSSDTMPMNSLKLIYTPDDAWKLLETNPTHPCHQRLSDKLKTSQDIQGLLVFLRSYFLKVM